MEIDVLFQGLRKNVLCVFSYSDMMKRLRLSKFVFSVAWLIVCLTLVLSSCQSEDFYAPEPLPSVGETFTVEGSIAIPDMPVANTRAFGNTPTANLKLTILEFDKVGTPSQSFITNVYEAETLSTTAVGNDGVVNFKVTINSSSAAKELHLVVTDRFIYPGHGSVASLLPALSVGTEAYWGRVEFDDGFTYMSATGETVWRDDVIKAKLSKVPVIRNFAKITVENRAGNFDFLGFDIVNVPTSGTVAPWNAEAQQIPDLLDGTAMKLYKDVAYSGILPAGVGFGNQESVAKNWVDGENTNMRSRNARYMFEHPYEPTRRTYLIINGGYRTSPTADYQYGFYKVDIGNIGADGTFEYYDIIRNINYNVVINKVLAPGTKTVAEAIERVPFNNLLAATETSSMLNVSDGENMLIVNDVNHVLVKADQKVDILYRYIEGVTGSKKESNGVPELVYDEDGPVIASISGPETFTDAAGKWVKYTVTGKTPGDIQQVQTVSVVDGRGLGRTITFVLRKPWQYVPIGDTCAATIAPGHADTYTSTKPQDINSGVGAELTVYFNLPDGIPDAVFPLDFVLEARYQGIENNKIGTLLVQSGVSLFDPTKVAIQYVKTVTLNEYKYQYKDDGTVDVGVPNMNHTIRARFLTIKEGTETDAAIQIHNEYFSPDANVVFKRTAAAPTK